MVDDGKPRENIVLIGFMGSGKSSIGRSIAKRLGFQFVDTDQLVIERSGGRLIAEIFEKDGEPAFRALETRALESLQHLNRCVIATGGGAVLREENRRIMRGLGFVVCLSATEEVTFQRVSRNSKRPLLQTENPLQTLKHLLQARRPAYEAAAQYTLDTSRLSQPEAAEIIMKEARKAFSWQRQE